MNTEQKMELLREKCSNCKWFKDGWCLDMNIHVNPNSLCVSWEKEKDECEIEKCCDNCKWYRSIDDYCVYTGCNIDGREKLSCFEEKGDD